MNTENYIAEYLEMEKRMFDVIDREEMKTVVDLIMETYEAEGTIYVFGNGGSASTASHMANDFNKRHF